jgi:hypothetical protein
LISLWRNSADVSRAEPKADSQSVIEAQRRALSDPARHQPFDARPRDLKRGQRAS